MTEPDMVLAAIGRAVGADLRTASPLQAVIEQLGDGALLLILDNLEQALDVAPQLEELLAQKGFESFSQAVGAAHRRQEVYR